MRSIARDRADLTAKALIRDEALRLFAVEGPGAVSLRRVAAAAGVSPGLVIHHYGSRQGLREAVDAHVGAVFDQLLGQVAELDWAAGGGSFAELIVAALPEDSPIPAYLRRLLRPHDEQAAPPRKGTARLSVVGANEPGRANHSSRDVL